jgi:Chlorophyll A-B binding protein
VDSVTDIKPTTVPQRDRPNRGFNEYAELLNGRAAMVGFLALIAIEYFTGKGVLSWLGLH